MLAVAVRAGDEGRLDDAEAAFRAVLVMSPGHDDALFGLGLNLMIARRFSEAVEPLARAAGAADAEPVRRQCLAHALFLTGAFSRAAETFAAADTVEPLPDGARLTWARAAAYAALERAPAEAALELYARIAGPLAEPLETVANEGFGVLVAFQRLDAARALGAWLEARDPTNVVRAHELRVLVDPDIDRAPPAYVEALFDDFAERFDRQLVDMLGYDAPKLLSDLVARQGRRFERILDLGCGTGLAAPHLRSFGGRLTGVDLSAAMLAKAAERGDHDTLVHTEAVAFMEDHPGGFDLIVAADVLIYFGDLAPVFAAAAGALPTGGLLAISTELGERGWRLLSSARYAHGDNYVRKTSAPWFQVVEREEIPLRREATGVTTGCLYVLKRL
ncbi:methyltransferase [Caulobacter sp. 1776]|uniref:methyltransferase domain-containing protein n=1 Tax=Caulobacter sp. 1776 TaxID=3156420 RepID=UPI003391DD3A